MAEDPVLDYAQINSELSLFDPNLAKKPQVVAVNKVDLPEVRERWPKILQELKRRGLRGESEPMLISAVTGENVRQLLYRAAGRLRETPPLEEIETVPVYRMAEDPRHFTIEQKADGWHVHGKAIERAAAMTYWEYDASVRRFQRILQTLGIEDALRKAGVHEGDTVYIGDFELEWAD
jgi:GTP-binding protein